MFISGQGGESVSLNLVLAQNVIHPVLCFLFHFSEGFGLEKELPLDQQYSKSYKMELHTCGIRLSCLGIIVQNSTNTAILEIWTTFMICTAFALLALKYKYERSFFFLRISSMLKLKVSIYVAFVCDSSDRIANGLCATLANVSQLSHHHHRDDRQIGTKLFDSVCFGQNYL